jgi:hypothetical protein
MPLQIRWLSYAAGKGAVRQLTLIIALAEALLLMLIISLLGVSVSAVTSLTQQWTIMIQIAP